MRFSKFLIPFSVPAFMAFAYVFPPQPQAPLFRPPLSQEAPDPRRVIVRSSSKAISGSYPLYDLLSIFTESGSVSVAVAPHPASSAHPSRPASLEIKSQSGSVHMTFPDTFVEQRSGSDGSATPPPPYTEEDYDERPGDNVQADRYGSLEHGHGDGNFATESSIPSREYVTSVSTTSASISGTYPLGLHTSFDSQSGSLGGIELVVVPITASGPRQLKTISRDGMQSVRIVDDGLGATAKNAWWEGMMSMHESRSGSISVEYPDSWEGDIEVETESGSISVTGRGVQIIRDGQSRVVARKGNGGGGKVMVRAGSGSVNLRFG